MARITVAAERKHQPVLLEESVDPENLRDEHSADQLIERIGWAVVDAEEVEHDRSRAPEDG